MNIFSLPIGARARAAYASLRMDGIRPTIAADLVASLEYHATNQARLIALTQTLGGHGLKNAAAHAWLIANNYWRDERHTRALQQHGVSQ